MTLPICSTQQSSPRNSASRELPIQTESESPLILISGRREMSVVGHSLPIHSAPVSNNVRYASDSDRPRHQSELMLCAHSNASMRDSAGHRALGTTRNGLMGTLMGTLWAQAH